MWLLEGKNPGLREPAVSRSGDPIHPCRFAAKNLSENHEAETPEFLRAISKAVYHDG